MDPLTGYTYCRKITLKPPSATLTDFPFPVRINASAEMGAACLATGYDVRFTASDGTTLLSFERDRWTVTAGEATGLWWVKIPSYIHTDWTTIYIHYGNASAVDASDASAVWDANFVGVYHGGDGTTLSVQDSSQAGNHGTNNGATAAAGIAGGAMSFDGSDSVALGTGVQCDAFTLSAWLQGVSYDGNSKTIVKRDEVVDPYERNYVFAIGAFNEITLYTRTGGASYSAASQLAGFYANASAFSTFRHVAVTWDSGEPLFYVDGALVASTGSVPSVGDPVTGTPSADIGIFAGGNYLIAVLDELRKSNIARSPAWIAAEYGTVAAPATWQVWGGTETLETPARVRVVGRKRHIPARERPERFTLNRYSPLWDGLVAFYGGGNGCFGSVGYYDAGPGSLHGTLTGFAAPGAAWGRENGRAVLSYTRASSHSVVCPTVILGTGDLTVSLRFKSTNTANYKSPLSIGVNSGNLTFDCDDGYGMWLFWDGSGAKYVRSPTGGTYSDGNWHTAVARRQGGTMYLLMDAVSVGTPKASSESISGGLTLGRWAYQSYNYYWEGQLCDQMIHSRALTDEEVSHYNDPANYLLRVGATDLIKSVRSVWPTATLDIDRYRARRKVGMSAQEPRFWYTW